MIAGLEIHYHEGDKDRRYADGKFIVQNRHSESHCVVFCYMICCNLHEESPHPVLDPLYMNYVQKHVFVFSSCVP